MSTFRTLNHRIPIQRERIQNIPSKERICTKCNPEDIGDEFYCIFSIVSLPNLDKNFLQFYPRNANAIKFNSLFCSKKKRLLINLANFVNVIIKEF